MSALLLQYTVHMVNRHTFCNPVEGRYDITRSKQILLFFKRTLWFYVMLSLHPPPPPLTTVLKLKLHFPASETKSEFVSTDPDPDINLAYKLELKTIAKLNTMVKNK